MNKPLEELDKDFIKIWSRYTLLPDYKLIKKPLEELAKLGQKDAIIKYYLLKIENKDKKIAPEVEAIVNSLDENESLTNACCKALKLYHAEMERLLTRVEGAQHNYELYNINKHSHIKTTKVNADGWYRTTTYKDEKQAKKARCRISLENYQEDKQVYEQSAFMQILKKAFNKYVTSINKEVVQRNAAIARRENFFAALRTYPSYQELYLYLEMLQFVDIVPADPIFKDTKNLKGLKKHMAYVYTSPFADYTPSSAEDFALAQLLYKGEVKKRSLFYNVWAKNYLTKKALEDYSQQLTDCLNAQKETSANLAPVQEAETNAINIVN